MRHSGSCVTSRNTPRGARDASVCRTMDDPNPAEPQRGKAASSPGRQARQTPGESPPRTDGGSPKGQTAGGPATRGTTQKQNHVFVVGRDGRGQPPIPPGQARKLREAGAAHVWRVIPYAIKLKEPGDALEVLERVVERKRGGKTKGRTKQSGERTGTVGIRMDPGGVTTGIAVLVGRQVVWGCEITMRGRAIRQSLVKRKAARRGRRQRHCPHRRAHCKGNPPGWLAPSHRHSVEVVTHMIRRLCKLTGATTVVFEMNAFDLRPGRKQGPGCAEANLRLAVLERDGYRCTYCNKKKRRMTVDHLHPKSLGGTDRPGNLVAACRDCNKAKCNQTLESFLDGNMAAARQVKRNATATMAAAGETHVVQKAQAERCTEMGLTVETGTGADTAARRERLGLTKTHWVDAGCAGSRRQRPLRFETDTPLRVRSIGHGTRQYQTMDKYGFPRGKPSRRDGRAKIRMGDVVHVVRPATSRSRTPKHWWGVVGGIRKSGITDVIDSRTGKKMSIQHAWIRKIGGRTGLAHTAHNG